MSFSAIVIWYSFQAVFKGFSVGMIGAFLARKHLISAITKSEVSKIIYLVLVPSLLFVNVAKAMSASKLLHWWPLPVMAICHHGVGLGIGMIINKFVKPPRNYERPFIAASTLGNVVSLPIVIISSVCNGSGTLSEIETCEDDGIAYISIYSIVSSAYMWTVVFYYLKKDDAVGVSPVSRTERNSDAEELEVTFDNRGGSSSTTFRDDTSVIPASSSSALTANPSSSSFQMRSCVTKSAPDIHMVEEVDEPREDEANRSAKDIISLGQVSGRVNGSANNTTSISASLFVKVKRLCSVSKNTRIVLSRIFNPPFFASLLGAIFGLITPLKNLMFAENGEDKQSAPLYIIADICCFLGGAAIPFSVIFLGSELSRGTLGQNVNLKSVVSLCIGRLIVTPIICTPIVLALRHGGLLPEGNDIFLFVLLLEGAVPSAISLSLMCQLIGRSQHESSIILFYQYLCSFLTLVVWVSVFLTIIDT
eukprot:Nk52_evm10s2133 gene=Nk52_evmTU10s2133